MKRALTILFLILLFALVVVFVLRFLTGDEDSWICDNRQWVKHGNPSASMPLSGCGEKYEVYKTNDFEVKYPYWPNIDPKNILEPNKTKLAVSNAGCNIVITLVSVPTNTSYKTYTEKLANDEIAKTKSKIITKDIKDNTAHFEGEVQMGNITLHSISYSYMTSKRNSY